MTTNGLLINYRWCTGCQSCEIACKNEHGYPAEKWGIKMIEFGPFQMEEKRLEWNYFPIPTSYCDLCAERVEAGQLPTCQVHCLANVIQYGPLEELYKKAAEVGPGTCVFVPDNPQPLA